MDIRGQLEQIGLSKQEAIVYLSILKQGTTKASQVAMDSKLKRETVYYTLKQLKTKGYVLETIKSNVKHYTAREPREILDIIEEEKQKQKSIISDIMPFLISLTKTQKNNKPRIEIHEGPNVLKITTAKLLKSPDFVICGYVTEEILKFMPMSHVSFRRKRKEKNIRLHVITRKTSFMKKQKKEDKLKYREIRFCDKVMKDINCAFYILKDSIIIIKADQDEQTGIYIEEPEIANLQRNMFEFIWDNCGK